MRLVASCLSKVINQNVLNTYIQQEYQKETMPGMFFFAVCGFYQKYCCDSTYKPFKKRKSIVRFPLKIITS